MLDLVSDRAANKRTTLVKEIFKVLCNNSSSVRLFTFVYPIGYQSAQFFRRALHYANSGRKFLRQSAQPPWGSVYIVIHRQTVSIQHGTISDPGFRAFRIRRTERRILFFFLNRLILLIFCSESRGYLCVYVTKFVYY